MASPKPTILFIHGGWHTPATYSKLTSALESAGYTVHLPPLPSVSPTRPPTANLATDTAIIRAYAEDLLAAGHTVLAIMHSYGGQVGTNALCGLSSAARAAQGLRGGIAHLMYVAAFALPEATCMIDKVREFGHEELLPLAFDFADDMSVVSRDAKTLLVGPVTAGDEAEAELEAYVGGLVRWNGQCMYDKIERCAWREDVGVTYVHCTRDMTVPFDYQKSMVEGMRAAGREVRTVEVETGHCPNFTKTAEVVRAVEGVVRKMGE
ncbi:Alpha/beta hydrolase fold-1 [Massariosphaeria phaeospora]|uniref:Alpha/beta hydrolase fold-1 n=1 Tax=Massariosphaeria phaeospora TaxID=100035 RepID=A0A7C8I5E6_9PLEO|nr:Alpha/beta hydrolase fold-1 [Massariosphaeria phaeospora]